MCKIVLNSSIHGVTSGYLVNYAKKSLFYSGRIRGATSSLDDGARHFRRHAFMGGSGSGVACGQLSSVVDSMFCGHIVGVAPERRGGAVFRGGEGAGGVLVFENRLKQTCIHVRYILNINNNSYF